MTIVKSTSINSEETNHELNLKSLIKFGLSENEAIIYIYLLTRGTETGGTKISSGTKLHRQYVYLSLPKLIELGFVEEIKHGKRNKYKAKPPRVLEKIAKKSVAIAEDLSAELEKISKIGHQQDFEIVIGEEAFRQFEIDRARSMKENDEQFIIGSSSDDYLKTMGEVYSNIYVPILEKKKIKTYYLAPNSQSKRYNIMDSRQLFTLRVFNGLSAGPLVTMVQGDNLIFYVNVYPVSIYIIRSKEVTEGYKQFFMTLWNSVPA